MSLRPPLSTLFPYTTLFRSLTAGRIAGAALDVYSSEPPTSSPSASRTCRSLCAPPPDRKSTRLNSSHVAISYAVFCLKKKNSEHFIHLICYFLLICI